MSYGTGPFGRRNGKYCPTIPGPDGTIYLLGEYEKREDAKQAYIAKSQELYPPPPPNPVDPDRHHDLAGGHFAAGPPTADLKIRQ